MDNMEVGYTTAVWDAEVEMMRPGRTVHKQSFCSRIGASERIVSIRCKKTVDGKYLAYTPSMVNEEWRTYDACLTCESRSQAVEPDWRKAHCTNTDDNMIDAPKGKGAYHHWQNMKAKHCDNCTIEEECGEYALVAGLPYGIWGGIAPRERSRIRSERGLR